MLRIIKFFKDALLVFPLTMIFQPIARYMAFIYYYNKLIVWIYKNKKNVEYKDFYSPFRNYQKRFDLYKYVSNRHSLDTTQINYIEFGVAEGASFKWWLANNSNANSKFFGFDTFEGLPEDWGTYDKGAMAANIPVINDERGAFLKGLFQDTLVSYIQENTEILKSNTQKIIHMDADLYSATAFTLSQLYPFLRKGDLIFFDEFSVAMHEFKAYDEFVNNFYIKLTPIASVNNFYQTAFIVE
ncbi:MAG: TylF/MycF/NovP-related O-methyltransferase [Phycisphaerales bacterium]|nr:TylF/MycF/NovP-related O-methyltransferase [Phycisphaerales bacterium]